MLWNQRSWLEGKHAFLSASQYHWIRYSDEKLDQRFQSSMEAARGTRLHQLAHDLIREGIKLGRSPKTLNMYVNDAIGFRMRPEQILYYSDNSFGTVDAISFRKNKLRISDLKNGITPASMDQLKIYAALFCLEYKYRPHELEIELRIYQNDEVVYLEPDPDEIVHIMDRIVTFDKRIQAMREEAE